MIAIDRESLDGIVETLRQNGCKPKKTPPLIQVGENSFAQFLYTPEDQFIDVQVDLLLAETELQKSAIARRVPGELSGVESDVRVLSCEDLILFKLIAGRMIDRADAAELMRENREQLDMLYLVDWVGRLRLEDEYGEVWEAAFPGEPRESSSGA